MTREWKPGTIVRLHPEATRIDDGLHDAIGVVTDQPLGSRGWLHWFYVNGRDANTHGCQLESRDVRPLVVIDPEDREQVERLTCIYDESVIQMHNDPDPRDVTPEQRTTAMQTALREFASPTPPEPDEPQGLGAVVEDAEGGLWVAHEPAGDYRWLRAGSGVDMIRERWTFVDAVRVLSEGVS